MATLDPPLAIESQPDQDVAAKRLDHGEPLGHPSARLDLGPDLAARQTAEDLIDQRKTLFDLVDADPYPCVDIAGIQHRHLERQLFIGRVSEIATRIEGAARGAPDIAAGAELARMLALDDSCGDGAILQRSGVVVKIDQARKHLSHFRKQRVHLCDPVRRDVARDPARHDRIHHQTVTERGVGSAQDALAQDGGVRMHQCKRSVVADRADVAEMVGKPLELGHQRPQILRPRRRLDRQRRFGGARESKGIGDRAVARGTTRKLCRGLKSGALHQLFNALVGIAEPLLQSHHMLAIRGETKMSGLDDAGMDGPDCDLVQCLAFGRQKWIGAGCARLGCLSEWRTLSPRAMVQPWSRIGGPCRLQSEKVADGALEPQRRRMAGAHAREFFAHAIKAEDRDLGWLTEQRHMHRICLAPKAEQDYLACGERIDRLQPALFADDRARPGPVRRRGGAMRNAIEQAHGRYPSNRATFWKPLTSGKGR